MPLTAATHFIGWLTPTGPVPTLRARMIAFQSGGNAGIDGQNKIATCTLCVAAAMLS
jgi:hypothetical protein